MDPTLLLPGLIGAAGIFLAFAALVFPRTTRLQAAQLGPLMRLQQKLAAAELPISAKEFALTCLGGVLLVGLIAVILGTPVLALVGMVIVPLLLWQSLEGKREAYKKAYAESLAEVVSLMREGFAATGALRDAMRNAVDNGPDPAAADFREAAGRHDLGEELDAAFAPILDRRHDPYLNMVVEALTLKAQQGGNAGEVLLGLENMIREQTALRKEIAAKQSQARLEAMIVSLAPVGFFLLVKVAPWMHEYEGGFYSTTLGQIVVLVAMVFSVVSYVLSRRMASKGLDLEVKEIPVGAKGA
ncbi:MAG TPA: type II secretion system F family protein [Anaerolineae bacterium]|nr:type II secretion system F family protein [Anaerolineae bacterium]